LYPLIEILVSNPLKSIIPVFLLHVLYHTIETPVGSCSFPLHRTYVFSKGLQEMKDPHALFSLTKSQILCQFIYFYRKAMKMVDEDNVNGGFYHPIS
jgi:hypothetical protein